VTGRAWLPLALAAIGLALAGPANAETRSWLALGDSYSSGEGISNTATGVIESGQAYQFKNCKRASGVETPATAWAVAAARKRRFGRIDFVACTGAITDNAWNQVYEARRRSGREQWDVLSFSFGGNNIGFADVLKGCIDWENIGWVHYDLTPGCDVSEQQLRRRVDMLVGNTPRDPSEYFGKSDLRDLFGLASTTVRNGGDVIVVGYPHLVEEVGRWDAWRRNIVKYCSGIRAKDVPMLRSVTGYLNQQIALAVERADDEYGERGVRFHFVDISQDPYESGDANSSRHGLCTDRPWLNGISPGNANGSFHPNQLGHLAVGPVVADLVQREVSFDDAEADAGLTVNFLPDNRPRNIGALDIGRPELGDNQTIADLSEVYGEPTGIIHGQPYETGCILKWESLGLSVSPANFGAPGACEEPSAGFIQHVLINDPRWLLDGALNVGMTEAELLALYPEASTRFEGDPTFTDHLTVYALRQHGGPPGFSYPTLMAYVRSKRVVAFEVVPALAGE
jgi:hypothetical protein